MFGLGWAEAGVVLVVGLLIFGPKRVPELGKTLGQALRGFRNELKNPTSDSESDHLE
ncbi:MAG: twin-arginine translocase TatA/TatE family subunit [Oscillatoriales cyanobacterium RM2_1_1]|nr:twin-arginine translocase TatA/TatE family subunit [Oscillatoriales cyanobacterium SM2_3_0]NJO46965.1 twin-arginine translocase TatA/TatE family subunit [Oscillatoriales cyanobacterium RM2_1_1]